jgi:acetyl esterase/lipase
MPSRGLIVLLTLTLFTATSLAQTTQPAAPRIKLWDKAPGLVEGGKDTDTDPTEPTMDLYLLPKEKATGAAVIIFPGGGYTHLSTLREGSDIAKMLNAANVTAFVVRYRHAPRYQFPIPIEDGQRAIRTVRANAEQYGISPNRIGIIGFSAGGHLASTVATQFDAGDPKSEDPIEKQSSRPDFAALLYPVITFTDEKAVHAGSRTALVGNKTELYAQLSAEQHVTKNTPPIFLAHSSGDRTVPAENSIELYLACHKANVPVELHIFEMGGHGFGLAPTDPALRVWPQLMLTWMAKNKWIPAATPSN